MSQSKQVKGRRKEGKGMHGSDGNDFWVGFKKEWLECENEECKVWVSMRVPDGWKGGEGRFKCGLCVMKDVVEVRNENENLKRQMEQMKNEDDKRKEAGVYEKNENVNTWATIAKRLTNEKTIEKLERVEESMMMNKNDVRKQVEESNYEARRKKRIIVFNMQEKEEKTDREQVLDMIGDMGVRVREEEVVDVVRMRKKEGVGLARPIIVEFKSEYDKWTVLRNKSDLREMNVYKKVFLEQDVSREEREKRRERVQERKAEWEKRGKNAEKRN